MAKKPSKNVKTLAASGAAGATAKASSKQSGARATAAPDNRPMTTAQTIVWFCILGLVAIVPIAMSNWTFLGFALPMTFDQFDIIKVFVQRALTLVAFGAWGWHILVEGGRIRRTKVDYLILALLGWIVLTTFTSISPPTAFFGKYRRFEGLVSFVNYAAIFWLTTQLVDRASRVRTVAVTLFWSAMAVDFYGLLQILGKDPITWGKLPFELTRAFSTYGNPDLLGGYIIFPLILALALALSEERTGWRITYWAGFGLTAVVWIMAFVRGAWIGGAVALVILAVAAWRQRVHTNVVDYSFAGGIGAVLVAVIVRSFSNPNSVLNFAERVKSIFVFDQGSAKTRFEIWQAAIAAIKDRPILGFGADTFRLIFPKYKPVEYVADAGYLSVADNVHNYPLQITAALGIPGFLLLYGVFAVAAVVSAPVVFARQESPKADRLLLAGFWAACAGYLVHLFFGISVTGSSFLLWLSMAAVLSPTATTHEHKAPSWGLAAASVALVVVAVLFVGNIVYVAADNAYLKARVVATGQERIDYVETAISRNPYNDMYRAELGLAHTDVLVQYLNQLQTVQQTGGDPVAVLKQAQAAFDASEKAFLDVIEFVPWEYDNYVFITNLYNLGAQYIDPVYADKAIEWGEKGVEVEPFGPAIRLQLSRALLARNRVDEAIDHMETATEMDPRYAEGWMVLGDARRAAKDDEGALEAYKKALALSPNLPGLQTAIEQLEATAGAEATGVSGSDTATP